MKIPPSLPVSARFLILIVYNFALQALHIESKANQLHCPARRQTACH